MRISETFKTREAEGLFSSLLVIVALLILPMLGAIPMLVGSVVALVLYLVLLKTHIRHIGMTRSLMICALITLVIAAALGVLLALNVTH